MASPAREVGVVEVTPSVKPRQGEGHVLLRLVVVAAERGWDERDAEYVRHHGLRAPQVTRNTRQGVQRVAVEG